MADGRITVEPIEGTSRSEPQCGHCGADIRLDRTCGACGRGNLAAHAFCGWCGERLPPTVMDPVRTGEITLASTPCESGEMTLISTVEPARHPAEGEVTHHSGIDPRETSSGPAQESTVADVEFRSVDGVAVVLLGSPEIGGRSQPRTTYRLELGEPFDVTSLDREQPATFTATVDGLRFDAIGDLDGVYIRVRSSERPIAYRRVRVEQELGTFQAVAPGETLPIGSLAIIGNALVRIEAIAT
jgi:hypothetical protein